MKTKKQKQEEALMRQAEYQKLTTKEKLDRLTSKGFGYGREFSRLSRLLEMESQEKTGT